MILLLVLSNRVEEPSFGLDFVIDHSFSLCTSVKSMRFPIAAAAAARWSREFLACILRGLKLYFAKSIGLRIC